MARVFLAALLITTVSRAAGPTPDPDFVDALWIAESNRVLKVARGGGEVLFEIPNAGKLTALAIDASHGTLWAYGEGTLYAYDFAGQRRVATPLPSARGGDGEGDEDAAVPLAIDPGEGSIWLGRHTHLYHFDAQGQVLHAIPLDHTIQALSFDTTRGQLWAATKKHLTAYDAFGQPVRTISLKGHVHLRAMVYDLSLDALWVADHHDRVRRYEAQSGAPQWEVRLAKHPEALAPDHDHGLWVSADEHLIKLNAAGQEVFRLKPFAGEDKRKIIALLTDPVDRGVWVASKQAVRYVEAFGEAHPRLPLSGDKPKLTIRALALYADLLPPLLSFTSPEANSYLSTNRPPLALRYQDTGLGVDTATLSITANDQPLAVACWFEVDTASCTPPASLPEGQINLQARVADFNGNRSALAHVSLTVDTVPPQAPATAQIQVGEPEKGTVTVTGRPGSVEAGSQVLLTNTRTGESVTVTANADGSFSAEIAAQAGDTLEIRLVDAAGNPSETRPFLVGGSSGPLPPDPPIVAPSLSETGITPLQEATAFLYSGPHPIQSGVAEGTIEPRRAAVMRGRVLNREHQPLPGVTVTVKDHPEFGVTQSRADRLFDMAVNGGGLLTLHYEKPGYLPVQRQVNTPWQDFVWAQDIVMVPLDAQATAIDLSTNTSMQVAQGSLTEDADGPRQATVLFPQGTQATLTLPDGSKQLLTKLHVRVTEYTVGEHGPKAMPAPLPPTSGYTYAVELSVDEAMAVGARRVDFNQPLPVYIDNFLDFPVGGSVPVGWYDREKAAWIPSENGRIVQVLGVDANGLAQVDTEGSGNAADATKLSQLGITEAERAQLAARYPAGKSLWRVLITHFTPWDCNWPYGPPEDAEPPPTEEPKTGDEDQPDPEDSNECEGCSIEAQSQTLGEEIPLTGTPFKLHYRSDRVAGRKSAYTLAIPLSGATVPASLKRIDLQIEIAGRRFEYSFSPVPNQQHTFIWDGRDAYGRRVSGRQTATVKVGYVYGVVYLTPATFAISFNRAFGLASSSGSTVGAVRGSQDFVFWKTREKTLGASLPSAAGLGSWSLDVHHAYDAGGGLLSEGDGNKHSDQRVSQVITTIAGNGLDNESDISDGKPATEVRLAPFSDISIDSQGRLYIGTDLGGYPKRVGIDGLITTLKLGYVPSDIFPSVVPGADGSIYYTTGAFDAGTHLMKMTPEDGFFKLSDYGSDGHLLLGPQGELYFGSDANVYRRDADGNLAVVAGTGQYGTGGSNVPATQASLRRPTGLALGVEGSLYIADSANHCIRRVNPTGLISTVAGVCGPYNGGFSGDGGLATQARLYYPWGIALAPEGSLYIADSWNHRIRRVGPEGLITTVAGNGAGGFSGDGGPATRASLYYPRGLALVPDGSLYIADADNYRIRRVAPPPPTFSGNDLALPSSEGAQIYVFDLTGRHLRTVDALTGHTLYTFTYDTSGRLIEVKDQDGDLTRIERNASGDPTAIVSADGQRTTLTLNGKGHLTSVTNPAGETYRMAYTAEGLLTAFTDPKGNTNRFEYDSLGRLLKDTNAGGGGWTLSRTEKWNGTD